MTDDLITRLRAKLDEVEQVARAVAVPRWTRDSSWFTDMLDPMPSQRRDRHAGWQPMIEPEDIDHIALHDPERELRMVAAHRKILDAVFQYEAKIDSEWGCCHDAEAIAAGACPSSDPNEIPAVVALAEGYGIVAA